MRFFTLFAPTCFVAKDNRCFELMQICDLIADYLQIKVTCLCLHFLTDGYGKEINLAKPVREIGENAKFSKDTNSSVTQGSNFHDNGNEIVAKKMNLCSLEFVQLLSVCQMWANSPGVEFEIALFRSFPLFDESFWRSIKIHFTAATSFRNKVSTNS